MDSFYDAPRPPPVPTKVPKISPKPCVPEVSMLWPTNKLQNTWGDPKNIGKMYKSSQTQEFTKKHVHFQSYKESSPPRRVPEPKDGSNFGGNNCRDVFNVNLPHENPSLEFNLNGKTFKQIYMANIPNRQLDLSLIEPSRPTKAPVAHLPPFQEETKTDEPLKQRLEDQDKEASLRFTSYKDFRSHHEDLKIVERPSLAEIDKSAINNANQNLSHYNFLKSIENTPRFNNSTCDEPQGSASHSKDVEMWQNSMKQSEPSRSSNEPTFKDLFDIVKHQNEQIMMLQQQVMSLKTSMETRQAEPALKSPQKEFFKGRNYQSPKLNLPKKFSIDLKATSFEVSFRPQMNKFRKQTTDGFEPKIQEILETSGDGKCGQAGRGGDGNNLTLDLQHSLDIREACPSPMPSIQINMDDYETSSNDVDDDEERGGMTFYQDLMAQVNNMLERVNSQPNDDPHHRVHEVKDATLHYLKSIGVNLPPNAEIYPKCDNGLDCTPSEISFAVKQLLLKYLPDDHLAKIACKKSNNIAKNRLTAPITTRKHGGAGAEFSIATLQYMKKYNLLNHNKLQVLKKSTKPAESNGTSRILDISNLKMQPKLL